jgi:L-alanine-DL-glutamate epimerase-like enolase superfamily enzyme
VEVACADLAARAAALPLWLWLGGAVRRGVEIERRGPARWAFARGAELAREGSAVLARAAAAEPRPWSALRGTVLEGRLRALRVAPLDWAGPLGVARLDALARVFQIELGLVADAPTPLARALALHLTVSTTMASLPVDFGPADEEADAARPARIELPERPGLGVDVDRVELDRVADDRWAAGADAAERS